MDSEKQNLILLMESYKNSMNLNISLSKQIQEVTVKVVDLDRNIEQVLKFQERLSNEDSKIKSLLDKIKTTSMGCKETILSILSNHNVESIKRAGKIRVMIWMGYVGSVTIIITLISLLIKNKG